MRGIKAILLSDSSVPTLVDGGYVRYVCTTMRNSFPLSIIFIMKNHLCIQYLQERMNPGSWLFHHICCCPEACGRFGERGTISVIIFTQVPNIFSFFRVLGLVFVGLSEPADSESQPL